MAYNILSGNVLINARPDVRGASVAHVAREEMAVETYGAAPYGTTISASVNFALIKSGSTTGVGGAIYILPSAVPGKVLHVKLSASQANITLTTPAADGIEGGGSASSIYLESTGSAVTLVAYDFTQWWII